MKHKRTSARALALTLKPLATGFFLFTLFFGSVTLLFLGKNHGAMLEDARMAIANAAAPVIQTIAKPAEAIRSAGNWLHEMATLHEENQRLKTENNRLLHWQTAATELSSENARLRSMLKFSPLKSSSFVSARIAMNASNTYSRSMVIDAGMAHGVVDDAAVVNESGLVGRITETGQKTARVLLITDINSRIPVVAQTSREHAIAGGTGGDALSLLYLPENSKLTEGETVVTSGDGSVLPAGLPVGVISKIAKGTATVQTFADWHSLEYISVLDTPR